MRAAFIDSVNLQGYQMDNFNVTYREGLFMLKCLMFCAHPVQGLHDRSIKSGSQVSLHLAILVSFLCKTSAQCLANRHAAWVAIKFLFPFFISLSLSLYVVSCASFIHVCPVSDKTTIVGRGPQLRVVSSKNSC